MLVMLLSTLTMAAFCDNSLSELSHSNLILATLWDGLGSAFLNFNAGKTKFISFDFLYTKDGFILDGKSSFKIVGYCFSFRPD